MRRWLLVAAVVAAAAAPAADAKTIKVDWRESVGVSGGGRIEFRLTKIVATTGSWAVTGSIRNATGARVEIDPAGHPFAVATSPNPVWHSGMALLELHRVYQVNIGGAQNQWWEHKATSFRPALPHSLAPGASWTGTLGGRAKLKAGRSYSLGLGLFLPQNPESGGSSVIWITDHSFKL